MIRNKRRMSAGSGHPGGHAIERASMTTGEGNHDHRMMAECRDWPAGGLLKPTTETRKTVSLGLPTDRQRSWRPNAFRGWPNIRVSQYFRHCAVGATPNRLCDRRPRTSRQPGETSRFELRRHLAITVQVDEPRQLPPARRRQARRSSRRQLLTPADAMRGVGINFGSAERRP